MCIKKKKHQEKKKKRKKKNAHIPIFVKRQRFQCS